jgi:hypothetical protein
MALCASWGIVWRGHKVIANTMWLKKIVIEARPLSCGSSPGRTSSLVIAHGVGPFQENKPPKQAIFRGKSIWFGRF